MVYKRQAGIKQERIFCEKFISATASRMIRFTNEHKQTKQYPLDHQHTVFFILWHDGRVFALF